MNKICNKCLVDKPLEMFYRRATGRYFGICKQCDRDRMEKNRKDNPDRWRDIQRRSTIKHWAKRLAKRNEWVRNNPDKRRLYVDRHRAKKYKMHVDSYKEIFDKQLGCCDICGKNQLELNQRLAVDHNHTTGRVRGLLCLECNKGLGIFKDSSEMLIKAKAYLDKYDTQEASSSERSPVNHRLDVSSPLPEEWNDNDEEEEEEDDDDEVLFREAEFVSSEVKERQQQLIDEKMKQDYLISAKKRFAISAVERQVSMEDRAHQAKSKLQQRLTVRSQHDEAVQVSEGGSTDPARQKVKELTKRVSGNDARRKISMLELRRKQQQRLSERLSVRQAQMTSSEKPK